MISFPLHRRQIHALRPAAWWQLVDGKQPGSGALLPAQLSSRAGPSADTALPRLEWVRAAPSGQRDTPGTRKQSGKVLYFLTVRQRSRKFSILLSMTFSWTLKEIFPAIKSLHLCFQAVFVLPFPSVSLLFFSCLCLKFLQCGTNTKHAPGRKHTAKFCLSSAWLKAVQKPSSCLLHIWG